MQAVATQPEMQPVNSVCQKIIGKRVAPHTIWRWVRRGNRGVKLNASLVCHQWYCTEGDFRAFIDGQTAAALAGPPAERDAATEKKLRDKGLLN